MKVAAWAAAIVVAIFLGVGIYRAGLDEVPPPSKDAQIVFHGGKAYGRRISTRSWSADYDRIVSNADQTILSVDGVRHGVIYKKGRPYLRVRAEHMTVNTVSHDFSVSGYMKAQTVAPAQKRTFETTSAVWSDSAQLLTLDHRVVIRTAGQRPLSLASARFNVRTGDLDVRAIDGPIRQ